MPSWKKKTKNTRKPCDNSKAFSKERSDLQPSTRPCQEFKSYLKNFEILLVKQSSETKKVLKKKRFTARKSVALVNWTPWISGAENVITDHHLLRKKNSNFLCNLLGVSKWCTPLWINILEKDLSKKIP